ncbi:MAG: hypothetical protein A2W90_17295 [Bacteroidetes bacterium GWF2_42_66]|nr:MAG: hypothetical protein A2W92_21470 [Bacteroidetes bacterium GWA2_42_15]OFX97655.1 MAG: hypothetical protein A2W89_19430 [Bacteroidetes bacterium GWE2_42_39]OFY46903.1 MAG: hypothetical protein A2W90_17295 [Bacteroidetes bacterium GWF2_42_66]HBL75739.1 hypothetical protein [Prolixibacteraceae bacterium]HCR92018.1 hypothetical protein [Prolixibacteraceae bacterium]
MNDLDFRKSLQNEKDKHRSILEGCVDAVVTISQYGIIEFFNKAAENLFGYERCEVLNKNVNMLMPSIHADQHDHYISRYVNTQIPRVIGIGREVEALTKTGDKVPILLTLSQAVVDGEYIFTAFIKNYSENKRIEAELRKLSLVASKTNNGVLITDKYRMIEWANEGFEKMSGYRMDELIGKSPGVLLQGKGTDPVSVRRMRARMNAGEPVVEEILNYHKNGKAYWVKLHIDPIFDENGNIEKFISIELDITEERKMKEEIRIAHERLQAWNTHYKAILDAIPDLMFRFDSQGTYLDFHSKKETDKDLIAPPEELLGKTIFDILPKETAEILFKHIKQAIETRESQTCVYDLEMPQGIQYYECRIASIDGKNEVLAIIRNITKRKKAELEMAESEIRLNETQRIARLGSWEIDREKNKIYWSKETYHLFGLEPSGIPPKEEDFLKIVHPADRIILQEALNRIITKGVDNSVEIRNILPDGSVIYILARGVPIFKNGKVVKIIGTLFDITERKKIEEDIRKAKEKAEESTKAKELFLANTSHEIRTPMNAIVGVTELLKKTPLNSQQLEYLGIIENSADNLLNIINDILDISKIESNVLTLEKSTFDLKEIVNTVINTVKFKAHKKNIDLKCFCPLQDKEIILTGDSLRLEQVLLNLTDNAIKFTNRGMVELNLSLLIETDDSCRIRFEIKDTGIGISSEKLEIIFNEFYQADTSTTRLYGGTGLGLSISKKLIGLMGGQLKVKSTLGEGTTFFFTLEFEKGKNPEPEAETNKTLQPELSVLSNIRTLLVEDQEFNQYVAKRMLETMKATVDIASNGKIAIEKLSANDYDVILMDIQMPVMDGVEATRFIREHMEKPKSEIPIIALTAHALKDDDKKYLSLGMNGYLSKPFKSDNLSSIIRKTLALQRNIQTENISAEINQPKHVLYDLALFRNMAGNDTVFLQNLVNTFIQSARKGFRDINLNIQAFNYKGIRTSAHSVKPGFKMIERTDIFEMLEQIEKLAEEKAEMSKISTSVLELEKVFGSIQAEMEKETRVS